MALHRFKYYLHDDYTGFERADYILEQIPELDMDADTFLELTGQPFYEIALDCTFNDITGEIVLVSATL